MDVKQEPYFANIDSSGALKSQTVVTMAQDQKPDILADLYRQIGQAFPPDGNITTMRFIYENVHQAAAEAPGVNFEEVEVVGRPCMWIRPDGASQ